ncbi:hypothetical protein AVEN_202255-1 [Araneus ventricosus]|uniref:Uncharacterized protein n=1 Tax=Araneus ventricosus TaxID=182803 RepID=A0A4Y2CMP3_ARAVE|nr:hypothetical protein AVEN_202255-1 [Araneus ventricosus]
MKKTLLASYKVSYKIARRKKPHTIGEELILPTATEIGETTFGDNFDKQLQSIPLSNDTVVRRIGDIAVQKIYSISFSRNCVTNCFQLSSLRQQITIKMLI